MSKFKNHEYRKEGLRKGLLLQKEINKEPTQNIGGAFAHIAIHNHEKGSSRLGYRFHLLWLEMFNSKCGRIN
jgi:hypothetical protein